MNTATKNDLQDAQDIMEAMAKRWPKMTLVEQVDAAARLKAVAKHCEAFDQAVKTAIKMKLAHKPGVVRGEIFKAELRIDDIQRLNQKLLKEKHPKIVEQCTELYPTEVITFSPR